MTEQLQAYVAWVNSQLKKRPGSRTVQDLRTDMRDGVALAQLIQVVAKEPLEGVHEAPEDPEHMRENVEKVLQFMVTRRIRMHHINAQDIVDGNQKSMMRLILALAARYKPSSVKQSGAGGTSSASSGSSSRQTSPAFHGESPSSQTMVGLAHDAATAIAAARHDAAASSQKPRRPRHLTEPFRLHGSGSDSDDRSWGVGSRGGGLHHPAAPGPAVPGTRGELDGASSGSSSHGSPRTQRRLEFSSRSNIPTRSHAHDHSGHNRLGERNPELEGTESVEGSGAGESSSGSSRGSAPGRGGPSPGSQGSLSREEWETWLNTHNKLSEEMIETKQTLLDLQELLLSGQPPDGQEDPESQPAEGATVTDQIVILKSKLQKSELLCSDLREELSMVKDECLQLQGQKSGLQQRLTQQEKDVMNIKAELLRVGFSKQSLHTEKVDLERQVTDKDKMILDLRRELAYRDRQIEELMANFQLQQHEKESTARNLRAQIHSLHDRLQIVGETESQLSTKVMAQDQKMAALDSRFEHLRGQMRPGSARTGSGGAGSGSDDMQLVRESLHSLRTSFPGNDPKHHAIDSLEQSIASLMERISMNESNLIRNESPASRSRVNFDSTGDFRRSPISALPGFPVQRLDASTNGQPVTKVLYFTDRTVTPFMCTIPKRLGEITLRDFKSMFDRQGNFRYHFKAMDPEFGTVKEEVIHEDDMIPGWEGKIVAWIEEDHG